MMKNRQDNGIASQDVGLLNSPQIGQDQGKNSFYMSYQTMRQIGQQVRKLVSHSHIRQKTSKNAIGAQYSLGIQSPNHQLS